MHVTPMLVTFDSLADPVPSMLYHNRGPGSLKGIE